MARFKCASNLACHRGLGHLWRFLMSNDTHPMPPTSSLNRAYDAQFATDDAYRDALPDPQNNGRPAVVKADAPIAHVGVSNFRLPLRFERHGGSEITLEASILGSVPCPGGRKGINMSRIVRSFYDHKDQLFSLDALEPVLRDFFSPRGRLRSPHYPRR